MSSEDPKIRELISTIQESLSPDLLKPEYREANKSNPMFGHCYVASEALFHALGGFSMSWRPVRARDLEGIVHWWLEDEAGGILDPTADQYLSQNKEPPYAQGRKAGYLTRDPSKRSRVLLDRIFFHLQTSIAPNSR